MKVKYKLTFLHKFLCIGLLFLAVLSLSKAKAYQKEFDYGPECIEIPFLQEGDYVFEVYYNQAPGDNEIIIDTDALTNTENQPLTELARVAVGNTAGVVPISLELKQDTRHIRLKTSMDTADQYYIERVVLQSVQLENKDAYLLAALFLTGAVVIFLLGIFLPTEKYAEPALLIGLGLTASMPLFAEFLLNGDDLGFHVARLEAIYQGLKAGELPVYLGTNKMGGFGMLSATMYPDLLLYPFAILRCFGVSLMLCYKLLLVSINIGSAFTSYYSAKSMCKSSKIGLWTSIFYTFALYRLTNLYFREALGETLAMVFLPLVIWGIYEVLWNDEKKWYLLALGVGGVLQSHVLSAEMCVLFLAIEGAVWLVSRKKTRVPKRFFAGIKAAGMTILVNAFFLVPVLFFFGEELQCFDMPNQLSETALYFSQMFSMFAAAEGKDLVTGNTVGEMPHTIGTVLLLGVILLCIEAAREREERPEMQVAKRCLIYGALALVMSSWLFPWKQVQEIEVLHDFVTSLQFAWRFLAPASALLAVVAAVGVVKFGERGRALTGKVVSFHEVTGDAGGHREWIYGVCAVLVICSTSYFFSGKGSVPAQFCDKMEFNDFGYTDSMYMYSDGESFQAYHMDYDWSDAYIKACYGTEVKYSDYERKGTRLHVTTEAAQGADDYLLFPFYYYPGYEILVNGRTVEVLNMFSYVSCKLPDGVADITVAYVGMPAFRVANWVSFFAVVGIAGYNIALFARKKRRNRLYSLENAK